ncbi:MAG: hypothetical protein E6Q67_10570 [Roseateles sp.]|nr:MAG: hypothetical protein E6Q67_10570 [Roseateles sp.]
MQLAAPPRESAPRGRVTFLCRAREKSPKERRRTAPRSAPAARSTTRIGSGRLRASEPLRSRGGHVTTRRSQTAGPFDARLHAVLTSECKCSAARPARLGRLG